MASPKLEPLVLSDEERRVLEGWARRRKTAQALAMRSRIVLACADGSAVSAVAAELGMSRATAGKWRSRFLEARLEGLSDEPRPGGPRTVTDEQVEKVIAATLEKAPPAGTRTGRPGRWPGRGHVAVGGLPDLAGVRPQAAHRRDLEAVHGPAVHRQGPRRRRPLHEPAGERPGAVRGREVPDPGPGPDRAVPADAADDPGADDARLRPQRHDQPVRRVRPGQRLGDRPALPPAPAPGVPAVPQAHRRGRPEGPGPAPGPGQLRHPQDPGDQRVAAASTPASTCTSPRPARAG